MWKLSSSSVIDAPDSDEPPMPNILSTLKLVFGKYLTMY